MPARRPRSRGRTAGADRTQRLRRYWDKHSRSYDRQMAFWERRLFGDGRQWVCAQASGEVLEVAIGTGRNLPLYPPGIRLTGVDFSPQMLELARRRAEQLAAQSTCAWVTPRRWTCPTPPSTRWSAPCRCAPSPTSAEPSPR
jgi:ubiquinone/menaquinone biosynthesis C-methylase UbiE